MTEKRIVIKRFEPFCLGYCKCGCGEEINIRGARHKIIFYKKTHMLRKVKQPKGSDHPSWRGGILHDSDGYILIKTPNHPRAKHRDGYVCEHILIMEKHLGRYLKDNEVVHHVNEVKDDNRIENLRLMTASEHMSLHTSKRDEMALRHCITCGSNTTYVAPDGRPNWYRKGDGIFQCKKCWKKERWRLGFRY